MLSLSVSIADRVRINSTTSLAADDSPAMVHPVVDAWHWLRHRVVLDSCYCLDFVSLADCPWLSLD